MRGAAEDRSGKNGNQGDWTTVTRRRNRGGHQGSNRGEDLIRIATNIYVSNLPVSWNSACLWKAFQHEGVLVDAFIPGKRDRGGSIFGFVRFVRVRNCAALLERLNNMIFEGRRCRANIAKYNKRSIKDSIPGGRLGGDGAGTFHQKFQRGGDGHVRYHQQQKKGRDERTSNNTYREVSYLDMLVGKAPSNTQAVLPPFITAKPLKIPHNLNLRSGAWLGNCLVGELKDLELLAKCMSMIHRYGLGNAQSNMSADFASFWNSRTEQWSRVVWLRIYGVPLLGWDPSIFACIAEIYGRILVPFDCPLDAKNFTFGRICILTANLDNIDCHSLEVEWRNLSFRVRIMEDGEWYPNSMIMSSEFGSDEAEDEDLGFADLHDDNLLDDLLELDERDLGVIQKSGGLSDPPSHAAGTALNTEDGNGSVSRSAAPDMPVSEPEIREGKSPVNNRDTTTGYVVLDDWEENGLDQLLPSVVAESTKPMVCMDSDNAPALEEYALNLHGSSKKYGCRTEGLETFLGRGTSNNQVDQIGRDGLLFADGLHSSAGPYSSGPVICGAQARKEPYVTTGSTIAEDVEATGGGGNQSRGNVREKQKKKGIVAKVAKSGHSKDRERVANSTNTGADILPSPQSFNDLEPVSSSHSHEHTSHSDEIQKTMDICNSLGYDMEGDDSMLKEVLIVEGEWVREIKRKHQINFMSCQDTQMANANAIDLSRFWDNSIYDGAVVESRGDREGCFAFGIRNC
ncbi:hypothetical protein LXL04_010976 [Taraxacum kok-saghyz]